MEKTFYKVMYQKTDRIHQEEQYMHMHNTEDEVKDHIKWLNKKQEVENIKVYKVREILEEVKFKECWMGESMDTIELLRKAMDAVAKEQERNNRRIRCNNTECGCYSYGHCSNDSVSIYWDNQKNNYDLTCDFNRK